MRNLLNSDRNAAATRAMRRLTVPHSMRPTPTRCSPLKRQWTPAPGIIGKPTSERPWGALADDRSVVRYGYYPHNIRSIVTSAQMAGDMDTAIREARRLHTALCCSHAPLRTRGGSCRAA
jgi:hypothetical protein